MMSSKGKHQILVNDLATRLEGYKYKGKQYYLNVIVNREYAELGLRGEIDAETINPYMVWHFYEVKYNDTYRGYMKAVQQYHRYIEAHPYRHVKGIYVTSTCVRRMR